LARPRGGFWDLSQPRRFVQRKSENLASYSTSNPRAPLTPTDHYQPNQLQGFPDTTALSSCALKSAGRSGSVSDYRCVRESLDRFPWLINTILKQREL